MKRGFTLIELLVVIAIIALLSSVVLASLNTARDKGRIAAGKQFDANLYHAAAEQAVGIWNFDECAGTSADLSGNNNSAVFTNGATSSPISPFSTGCSASLDGSNDYIATGLIFNATTYTQSAWLYLNAVPGGTVAIFGNDNGSYQGRGVYMGANRIPYIHNCHPSACNDVSANAPIPVGQWTHFAAVVSSGTVTYYINGQASGGGPGIENYGIAWIIGAMYTSGAAPWGGFVDNVRFYAKDLTASEIRSIYAEDAAQRGFAQR